MALNNRTLQMINGDFLLLGQDANGVRRHATVNGLRAFGQRVNNRLLAIKGESPWDPTMGMPYTNLAELQSSAVFASLAAEAVRADDEVQSLRRVVFETQSDAEFQNGEQRVTIEAVHVDGENLTIQTTVS